MVVAEPFLGRAVGVGLLGQDAAEGVRGDPEGLAVGRACGCVEFGEWWRAEIGIP